MKLGRNDKCWCGSNKKYKKCCLETDKKIQEVKSSPKVRPLLRKQMFISEPYTKCPKCERDTYGVSTLIGHFTHYSKECTECGHSERFNVPKIKKAIVYLDQFAISNITKALDPDAKSHDEILKQPFWLELYKKLDALSKLQLVICPDSTYHFDESILSNDPSFKSLRKLYEHLSHGTTFFDHNTLTRFQIQKHLESYLAGNPAEWPQIDPEDIVHGELHEWQGTIQISVNMKPYPGQIDSLKSSKDTQHKEFEKIFRDWNQQKGKDFMDWVKEEANAFGTATMKSYSRYLKKTYFEIPQKYATQYLATGKVDVQLEDIFPPPSKDIVDDVLRIINGHGIKGNPALEKMGEYLTSPSLINIPYIHISSLLFAAIARKAVAGQLRLPSPGTFVDVNAIASLMPYCDAMLVDNEMATLLKEGPLNKETAKYNTKIFSLNSKQEFLDYLNELEKSADTTHLELVERIYGKRYSEPYLTLLARKDDDD